MGGHDSQNKWEHGCAAAINHGSMYIYSTRTEVVNSHISTVIHGAASIVAPGWWGGCRFQILFNDSMSWLTPVTRVSSQGLN